MIRSLAAAFVFVVFVSSAHAQRRPDYSGTWKRTTGSGMCAASVIIVQDDASLRLQSGADSTSSTTYKFDGTDTVAPVPAVPPRPPSLSPGAWVANRTRSVSRAAWNGDQFVTVTHETMTMTWPAMVSGEFDRESVFKDSYSFSPAGQLVIDRQAIMDPLPGGTSQRLTLPEPGSCVYAKAHE